ncbi:MAG: hypothetical protein ABI539_11640, partial [Acidobacteriota bacterium]
ANYLQVLDDFVDLPADIKVSTSVSPYYIDPNNGEMDAGGTNAGLKNDYSPGSGAPPEVPQPLESESPLHIDGRRVTCTVNGFAMGCQLALGFADHGSVFPLIISENAYSINQLGAGYWVERFDPTPPNQELYGGGVITEFVAAGSGYWEPTRSQIFTPPTAVELKKTVQDKYGKDFDGCAKKYLKRWASRQLWGSPAKRQEYMKYIDTLNLDLRNLKIDARLTSAQISRKYHTGYIRNGKFEPVNPYAIGIAPNTIVIAKERWNSSYDWVTPVNGRSLLEQAVIHEAGNILSENLTGSSYSFGSPTASDPDSGYAVQKCVFGN